MNFIVHQIINIHQVMYGGCDDEFIFDKLKQEVAQNDEPTVYVILSVSNHAPYSVDLAKAGFPKEEVRAKLPADVQNNEDFIE
ncbi:Sulfatase [Megamonas hypermegale ART12/1]|nr:Sulfatase [Megamonas hypermegale ART12/1]